MSPRRYQWGWAALPTSVWSLGVWARRWRVSKFPGALLQLRAREGWCWWRGASTVEELLFQTEGARAAFSHLRCAHNRSSPPERRSSPGEKTSWQWSSGLQSWLLLQTCETRCDIWAATIGCLHWRTHIQGCSWQKRTVWPTAVEQPVFRPKNEKR